ncbi:MAG: phosphatase family protein [Solirubrobacterales bacterium]|nr:phosphatase family protein [Solirubrobacterales bacterium]
MDYRIAHALDRFALHHDGFEDVLRAYVGASQYLFFALVVGLVAAAIVRGEVLTRSPGVLAGCSAALALAIAKVISILVDRPRPFVAHHSIHDFLAHAPDAGMPSDHATAAFAIGTALLLSWRRIGVVVLLAAAVLAIGRVFLGVHYLSDVAVGAVLGAGTAVLVSASAQRLPVVTAPTFRRREVNAS